MSGRLSFQGRAVSKTLLQIQVPPSSRPCRLALVSMLTLSFWTREPIDGAGCVTVTFKQLDEEFIFLSSYLILFFFFHTLTIMKKPVMFFPLFFKGQILLLIFVKTLKTSTIKKHILVRGIYHPTPPSPCLQQNSDRTHRPSHNGADPECQACLWRGLCATSDSEVLLSEERP